MLTMRKQSETSLLLGLSLLFGNALLQGCGSVELEEEGGESYHYECFWENGDSDYRYYVSDDMMLECDYRTQECIWSRSVWDDVYASWAGRHPSSRLFRICGHR